jgi:hypothetical protein
MSRDRAREVLNLRSERPCAIVCAAGNADELDWYAAVTTGLSGLPECDVRCIGPAGRPGWISYWPAMDLYAAADVVIGGGGYNTVYECLACGVPLIARPWQRKYDRQKLRAERAAAVVVDTPAEAVASVRELLASRTNKRTHPRFDNGTAGAVALIRKAQTSSL